MQMLLASKESLLRSYQYLLTFAFGSERVLTVLRSISGSDSTRLTEFLDRTAVDVDDWTANFERKYGFTHPIFTGGKFSETIKVARDLYKLVVVNLHSKALDCKDFCRYVVCDYFVRISEGLRLFYLFAVSF
jgi:hypothetical protein